MENNWEPRVGQKVVALVDFFEGDFKKGDTFIIGDCRMCPGCKKWVITIGLKSRVAAVACDKCDILFQPMETAEDYYKIKYFAPVSDQYADMTSEIAQSFKEHPDTADQPVKVLETVN